MKKVSFIFSLFIFAVIFLLSGCSLKNSPLEKTDSSTTQKALRTAEKTLESAKNKNPRAFAKNAYQFRKKRSSHYESYQLLQNVSVPEKAKWTVRKDKQNGTINVSCPLNRKCRLVIVLKPEKDQTLRFAYACTLNA